MTDVPSRQRRKQLANRAAGLCEKCTRPLEPGRVLCSVHLEIQRNRQIRKVRERGGQPWKPGGRGRPPVSHLKPETNHEDRSTIV